VSSKHYQRGYDESVRKSIHIECDSIWIIFFGFDAPDQGRRDAICHIQYKWYVTLHFHGVPSFLEDKRRRPMQRQANCKLQTRITMKNYLLSDPIPISDLIGQGMHRPSEELSSLAHLPQEQ